MPSWIIAAALTSIAVTALLSWALWRMNAPQHRDGGDSAPGSAMAYGGDSGPSHKDAGGFDGGGDGGGD